MDFNNNLLMAIIFFSYTLLNYLGILKLDNQAIFFISSGALLISLAGLFMEMLETKKRLKKALFVAGNLLIVICPQIIVIPKLTKFVNSLDMNNFLLIGLGVSFLTFYFNNLNSELQRKKHRKELEEEKLKIIKKYNELIK